MIHILDALLLMAGQLRKRWSWRGDSWVLPKPFWSNREWQPRLIGMEFVSNAKGDEPLGKTLEKGGGR